MLLTRVMIRGGGPVSQVLRSISSGGRKIGGLGGSSNKTIFASHGAPLPGRLGSGAKDMAFVISLNMLVAQAPQHFLAACVLYKCTFDIDSCVLCVRRIPPRLAEDPLC